ncbi:MAG: inorganic diphosphatase [Flavobacteriales bacterium]|nr:inorganic diphosphatase [Flavobacteriales bacterium]
MILHPWHEVANHFDRQTAMIDGLIEIPSGSKAKYESDKASGLMRLDRVVFAAFVYPVNYGFIPQTLGEDGDPLDILVLSEVSIHPNCLVRARVIGYMQMNDTGKCDEKIIAVAEGDMSVAHIQSMDELPENFRQELRHFFTNYKTLMKREVTVDEFLGRKDAIGVIDSCIVRYQETFKK